MVVGEFTQEADLLVIGGGPGGYHAAFRAAENGISTTILEADGVLGGVCLQRGCIPSKTYLAMAETMHLAESAKAMGITFSKPKLDIDKLRQWKIDVVTKLSGGLDMLCKKHKVERLTSPWPTTCWSWGRDWTPNALVLPAPRSCSNERRAARGCRWPSSRHPIPQRMTSSGSALPSAATPP